MAHRHSWHILVVVCRFRLFSRHYFCSSRRTHAAGGGTCCSPSPPLPTELRCLRAPSIPSGQGKWRDGRRSRRDMTAVQAARSRSRSVIVDEQIFWSRLTGRLATEASNLASHQPAQVTQTKGRRQAGARRNYNNDHNSDHDGRSYSGVWCDRCWAGIHSLSRCCDGVYLGLRSVLDLSGGRPRRQRRTARSGLCVPG